MAGNLVNDMILASLEYAVEHLKAPLILVLGHQRCGAVAAALEGGQPPGHLSCLTEPLQKAAAQGRAESGDPVDNAVKANVRQGVDTLRQAAPILAEAVRRQTLQVAGAYYELSTGRVEIIC